MKICVTGGCGFIGSHFIHLALAKDPHIEIINLDKLTYAGRLENVEDLKNNKRYKFVKGDICDANIVKEICKDVDLIINFAAETHVDKSILSSGEFVKTDVLGTQTLLQGALDAGHEKFFHISTDEVYGSIEKGYFKEEDMLKPNSPYAASKAGAEMVVRAYEKTYGLKSTITRSSNNYGPNQHPEKFIPRAIACLLQDKKMPIYGTGKNVRNWIYVLDNCEAIWHLLQGNYLGIYNIGAECEFQNIDIAKKILKLTNKNESYIEYVADRKGHDWRYGTNINKIMATGWKPNVKFEDGLDMTVEWYKNNVNWWKKVFE